MLTSRWKCIPITFLIVALFIASCVPSPSYEDIGIVFTTSLNRAQDMYRIANLESQELERLTFTPDDFEKHLLVSDDGGYALFAIYGPNLAWHTYKLDLESFETTLFNKPETELASIHPIGWAVGENHILVLGYQARIVYNINLDNESVEEIDLPSQKKIRPVHCKYSFDEKFIACDLFDKWANPIISSYIYIPETKVEIQLGGSNEFCFQPEWSPAENKILLHCFSDTEDIARIYLYEVNEDNPPITVQEIMDVSCAEPSLRARVDAFAWSPDGKYFVATSCTLNGRDHLFALFNADGSLNQYLSPRDISEDMIVTDIEWSPDGQNILYIAGQDEESLNIYMMNADGSGNYALTKEPSNYSNLWVYSKP